MNLFFDGELDFHNWQKIKCFHLEVVDFILELLDEDFTDDDFIHASINHAVGKVEEHLEFGHIGFLVWVVVDVVGRLFGESAALILCGIEEGKELIIAFQFLCGELREGFDFAVVDFVVHRGKDTKEWIRK